MFDKNSVTSKMRRQLAKISSYREKMKSLTDEEMRDMTDIFKERIKNGETLDSLLPEAYALVREAARRTVGMEHFDVQILGGIALHEGKIAELKTGEGKTLVETLPAYLNALEGKGVHIVTVNDYLAKRDEEWMGQVYRLLGLTVGVVLSDAPTGEKKRAYGCDITYVTNNELGFDYLRDNMASKKEHQVLRGLHYCIIDEVDSVLIDEARTPLIISGPSGKPTVLYGAADTFVKTLKRGDDLPELTRADIIAGKEQEENGDYIVNEKDEYVHLTSEGMKKAELFFGIENIADTQNQNIMHCIVLSLRANSLMKKDRDYIVRDDEVLIVDEFTGRVMEGRRYSDGLHQAIEAKEHVKVKEESITYATITFQNFFNKFEKKSGMTGTALTEKSEFKEIYGLDVIAVPTNCPVIRNDMQDSVYRTQKEKYERIVEEVKKAHEKGQPVLVGTVSIEISEVLSALLKKENIAHNVLNAKEHEREAEIIADAGHFGSVTIATNMAGRGTDIKLDDRAKEAGGLYVIGTERHESRRIDNQLRGRSGRQGDPGMSKFFLSLEDDLLRLFGSEKMESVFNSVGIGYGEEIASSILTKSIEKAQKRVEGNNFNIRKNLMGYDRTNNEQRELIYSERQQVLDGEDMKETIQGMIEDVVNGIIEEYTERKNLTDEACVSISRELAEIIHCGEEDVAKLTCASPIKTEHGIISLISDKYSGIEKIVPKDIMKDLERAVVLRMVDMHWKEHIDNLDKLRQSMSLMTLGQKDPRTEYRIIAFDMFDEMNWRIAKDVVRFLLGTKVEYV